MFKGIGCIRGAKETVWGKVLGGKLRSRKRQASCLYLNQSSSILICFTC